jgi:hypothetical protein
MPYSPRAAGELVAGTTAFHAELRIDDGQGFALVPWAPALAASPSCCRRRQGERRDRLEFWTQARAGDLIVPLARKGVRRAAC